MDRILEEPALLMGLAQAALALAVGFGLNISTEQMALIVGFIGAVLSVVVRQSVVPTTKLPDRTVRKLSN